MRSVDSIIDETIGKEGGYSNHPADRGGPTRWGVTQQTARAFGYAGAMQTFSREMAVDVYRRRYWFGPQFNLIAEVFPRAAVEMFDTGVNMGPAVPSAFLQRALNVLNRGGSDYPDIVADGRCGLVTAFACRELKRVRGANAEVVVLRALECLQGERYIAISEGRAANEAFTYGWFLNRIGDALA